MVTHRRNGRRALVAALCLIVAAAVFGGSAAAQISEDEIQIVDLDSSAYPDVRVIVDVPQSFADTDLTTRHFALQEGGVGRDLEVQKLSEITALKAMIDQAKKEDDDLKKQQLETKRDLAEVEKKLLERREQLRERDIAFAEAEVDFHTAEIKAYEFELELARMRARRTRISASFAANMMTSTARPSTRRSVATDWIAWGSVTSPMT